MTLPTPTRRSNHHRIRGYVPLTPMKTCYEMCFGWTWCIVVVGAHEVRTFIVQENLMVVIELMSNGSCLWFTVCFLLVKNIGRTSVQFHYCFPA